MLRIPRWARITGLCLFAACWLFTLPVSLRDPQTAQPSGDAAQYVAGGWNLAMRGIYSMDGVHPFFEREPGYSVFLSGVYSVTRTTNPLPVFAAQAVLYFVAAVAFVSALWPLVSRRAALITFFVLLVLPPVHHVIQLQIRESLALSIALLWAASLLCLRREPALWLAAVSGALLGALILTYTVFLPFPLFLIALLAVWRVPWSRIALATAFTLLVAGAWGGRNYLHRGETCMTGCYRAVLQWYVRGEQAETIRGLEPLGCLYTEYVSRDWTGRDTNCNFNAVWHRKWPQGFVGVEADRQITREGQAKILANFGPYLWFSLFEVIELHLPFVDNWGFAYNLLSLLAMLALYLGAFVAVPDLRRRDMWLFPMLIGYITGVFALTDAIPRYLIPVIFSYAVLAGVGYDVLLGWFEDRRRRRG